MIRVGKENNSAEIYYPDEFIGTIEQLGAALGADVWSAENNNRRVVFLRGGREIAGYTSDGERWYRWC